MKNIYDLKANWHLLQPFLKDKRVQRVLNTKMKDFCKQYPKVNKGIPWKSGNAPWKYTTSDFWDMKIFDAVQADEGYKEEVNALFYVVYGADADPYDDELWEETIHHDEYIQLENKYYAKHEPKAGTIEFYQFMHGCHWIVPFVSKLINVALGVRSFAIETDYHSVAYFEKDGVSYYADILIEWDSVEQLWGFLDHGK